MPARATPLQATQPFVAPLAVTVLPEMCLETRARYTHVHERHSPYSLPSTPVLEAGGDQTFDAEEPARFSDWVLIVAFHHPEVSVLAGSLLSLTNVQARSCFSAVDNSLFNRRK